MCRPSKWRCEKEISSVEWGVGCLLLPVCVALGSDGHHPDWLSVAAGPLAYVNLRPFLRNICIMSGILLVSRVLLAQCM